MLNVDERSSQIVRHVQFDEDAQRETVLGVFVNGDTLIHNVPYNKHFKHGDESNIKGDGATYDLFLTHDVLFQLSHIMKVMQEKNLQTVDYQRFLIKNSRLAESSRYGSPAGDCLTLPDIPGEDSGATKSIEVLTSIRGDPKSKKRDVQDSESQKKLIRKNVMDHWLKKYGAMKLQAKSESGQISQTVTARDSKAKKASEWLAYFHERLDQLPELERNIIIKKYLETGYAGRYPLDDIVINSLFISQRQYYYRKKEALYLLGLALGDNWSA